MTNNEVAVKLLVRRFRSIIPDHYEIRDQCRQFLPEKRCQQIAELVVRLGNHAAAALEESLADISKDK